MVDFACLYERFDPPSPSLQTTRATSTGRPSSASATSSGSWSTASPSWGVGPSTALFTGHRGGGKTTELKRAQQRLESAPEGSRYFVSFPDGDDVMDLDDVDPTDLVLAVVRQLITDARDREGIDLKPGRKFRRTSSSCAP